MLVKADPRIRLHCLSTTDVMPARPSAPADTQSANLLRVGSRFHDLFGAIVLIREHVQRHGALPE